MPVEQQTCDSPPEVAWGRNHQEMQARWPVLVAFSRHEQVRWLDLTENFFDAHRTNDAQGEMEYKYR